MPCMLTQVCFQGRFVPYNAALNHVEVCKEYDLTGRINHYCLSCRRTLLSRCGPAAGLTGKELVWSSLKKLPLPWMSLRDRAVLLTPDSDTPDGQKHMDCINANKKWEIERQATKFRWTGERQRVPAGLASHPAFQACCSAGFSSGSGWCNSLSGYLWSNCSVLSTKIGAGETKWPHIFYFTVKRTLSFRPTSPCVFTSFPTKTPEERPSSHLSCLPPVLPSNPPLIPPLINSLINLSCFCGFFLLPLKIFSGISVTCMFHSTSHFSLPVTWVKLLKDLYCPAQLDWTKHASCSLTSQPSNRLLPLEFTVLQFLSLPD